MKLSWALKTLAISFLASALVVFFQNCSDVGFNSDASKNNNGGQSFPNGGVNDSTGIQIIPPNPIDPSIVDSNCANGTIKEKVVQVSFPNPNKVCEWGTKGNLSIRDRYFRGRRKQTVDIPLPANATLCDAEFDFSNQEFWYDDVFVLTLDSNILVSSYNWGDVLSQSHGFYQYNWSAIADEFWDIDGRSEDYCAGKSSGLSTCSFPAQHDTDPISLSMQPELLRNAMANSGFVNHSFHFITTGDNDESDCQHFDMNFEVRFKYVD